ncbi:hypothetical protein OA324_01520 [Prochlorococcus sp. AH-716-O05]|nr:hypothetical protein [Prochlorococcus sp. AH-716-O05]
MLPFLKIKKSLVIYSLLLLIVIPIFGFNFLISLIGNFLLLILLVPILIFLIALIGFNSLNSKIKTCNECGATSLGINDACMNCGADLSNVNVKNFENLKQPSETTIEIKAEEVK